MQIAVGVLLLGVAFAGLGWRIEPVPTWFYVFAWYPLLLVADGVARRRDGNGSWVLTPRAVSWFGWSVAIWLWYEAANLRLHHWYYVSLPPAPIARTAGIVLSFATVIPALLMAERVLAAYGVGNRLTTQPLGHSARQLTVAQGLGWLALAGALWFPAYLSLFVWAAALLIVDPWVFRRAPDRSLLHDAARGQWGRIARVMLGGLIVGVAWESLNYVADGKWIYTVPFLERLKIFEMPPLGFVGFPVFALSAFAWYHALVTLGVARDPRAVHPIKWMRTGVLAATAIAVSIGILRAMDRRTVSSTVVRLQELPGFSSISPRAWDRSGINRVPEFRSESAVRLAETLETDPTTIETMQTFADLALLRGIGAEHARQLDRAGIRSICQLARADPVQVWLDIHGLHRGLGPRPTPGETRVWHRAATRACSERRDAP